MKHKWTFQIQSCNELEVLSEEWIRKGKNEKWLITSNPQWRTSSPGTSSCQSGYAITFIKVYQIIGPVPSECGKCLAFALCAYLHSFPEKIKGEVQITSGYSLLISASADRFCG